MATKRIKAETRSALTAEQKAAFVLLLSLGFGGVFFGFKSFGANLYRPIQMQFAKYYTGETDFSVLLGGDDKATEELKKKDTDFDGLMDYDELYIYKTSPYLKDSDSDGVDDKTEVFSNNDPNCPEGATCGVVREQEDEPIEEVVAETIAQDPLAGAAQTDAGLVDVTSPDEIKQLLDQIPLDDIRSALVSSGLPQDQVAKISDADLRGLYNKAIAEATASGTFDSSNVSE